MLYPRRWQHSTVSYTNGKSYHENNSVLEGPALVPVVLQMVLQVV
jgi:hypothetical protein